MRPLKLSSKVFLELPPVLGHYVENERNLWLSGNPKRGRLSLLNRAGVFSDLEGEAVQRRHLFQILGRQRAQAFSYRVGFEQGRRDASRHITAFADNARLALQAALVFGQLQGRYVTEGGTFEFNLEERTLYREVIVSSCVESVIHRMTLAECDGPACWGTAGYLSGHVSEILGRKVVTLEVQCACGGHDTCRFVSRLDSEWGSEADWAREALDLAPIEEEITAKDVAVEEARAAARKAQASLSDLSRRIRADLLMDTLVAESDAMGPVLQRTQQLSESDAPVLLAGETGTGKETIARALHYGGPRKKKPFVPVDCKSLGGPLLLQELIGFEKASLVGVPHGHKGALLRANGGTVFISEITKLTPDAQGALLNALKDGTVDVPGADRPAKTDVRIIAGAAEDPLKSVKRGTLREDLYYALAIGRIELPPLRERDTDIIRLAEGFLREFQQRHGREGVEMSNDFKRVLLDCAWPGNIRQLRSVIEHAVIMGQNGNLTPRDLPDEILATRWTRQPQELSEDVIRAALARCHGNRSKAADLLGVGRTTLWRAMRRTGVE